MRVAIAALCEEIRFRDDGRMDLLGVAPDQVMVSGFPWRGTLTLALVLEMAPDDDRSEAGMNVSVIRTDDGQVVGQVDPASARQPREVPTATDVPVHLPFELGLAVAFSRAGNHRILVRSNTGEPLADVAFGVRKGD